MTATGFTPVELVLIAHACEDYAGNWYGPQPGGMHYSRWDCDRYVTEGHLKVLHNIHKADRRTVDEVWAAVKAHLDAHPEILAAGRLTDEQRAANKAARDRRAQDLLDQAEVPFLAGRWDDALALVDQAEMASPGYTGFESYRRIIRKKAAAGVSSG